jgi:hypothetical protein
MKKRTDHEIEEESRAASELAALEADALNEVERRALEEADRALAAELAARKRDRAPITWYDAMPSQAAPPPPEPPAELRDDHGRVVDPATGQPVVIAQPGSGDEPDRDQYGRIIERPR